MGNDISALCGCSYNQNKGNEQKILDYAMNPERIRNKEIYDPDENKKDDLLTNNLDRIKVKSVNEKSTNLSDNDEGNLYYKSNQESNPITVDDIIYEGQTVNGMKNGKGTLKKRITGEIIFDGFYKDDKFEGEGILYLNNGYVYEGNFSDGKKQGKGTLFSEDQKFKYQGTWIDDEKEGHGEELFPDGTKFEGEFQRGKKNGKGKYFFTNGSYYEGELQNDKLDGLGKFMWSKTRFYEGAWKNNSINGFGIFIDSGKIYIGNFINDKKNGIGIYISKNSNNKIVGNFKDNQINGLSIVLKDNENFDNSQICIMENGKSIPCTNENEKKNLKLHQEYKDLRTFYQNNLEYVRKKIKDI